MLLDLRYALRTLAQRPAFVLTAIATLALGIGANTAVFSVIDAALLRPLPVREPERLVRLYTSEWSAHGVSDRRYGANSYPDFLDLRAERSVFEDAIAFAGQTIPLTVSGATAPVQASIVSGNFFTVLGVRPALGRAFAPDEDSIPRAHPVVVISHALWQRRFGGDSAAVGSSVNLGRLAYTVIGVAPPSFHGVGVSAAGDLWVPLAMYSELLPGANWLPQRDARSLGVIARLRAGVPLAQAEAAMRVASRRLAERYPEANGNRVLTVAPSSTLLSPAERANTPAFGLAATLMAVVGVVLVVACANLANLLLARATARRREIAIRLSLGATRWRLVRQLLVESVLLSLAGGAAGLLLAMWGTDALHLLPLPSTLDFSPDRRILLFTFLLAVATGVLFGLAPALQATRPDLVSALKEEPVSGGWRRSWLRSALVVSQLALSMVLLMSAGLLVRSLQRMRSVDPGFDATHLLLASVQLEPDRYKADAGRALYETLLERVRALPGVRGASMAMIVPLSGSMVRTTLHVDGYRYGPREDTDVSFNVVGPDYFETLGLPLVRGRGIATDDDAGAPPVMVVNETMARQYWPGEDPLGKLVRRGGPKQPPIMVVGVARDAMYESVGAAPHAHFYLPVLQNYESYMQLHVRLRCAAASSECEMGTVAAAVRREMRALDASLGSGDVTTIEQVRRESLLPSQVGVGFISGFGGLALLLAAVGLYGVMSYTVAGRTREIGIRVALGARRGDVMHLVVSEGMRLAGFGMLVGGSVAMVIAFALSRVLYGVRAVDLTALPAVLTLLSIVALAATWGPAWRAARVDPVEALRRE